MKWAALALIVLLAVGVALWQLAFPRSPAGYHWPQHTVWGEGPTALVTGVLVERGGCIYLGSETGEEIGLLVWPMFASLAENDDELVVRIDGRTVAIGDGIRGGGGYYEGADLPDSMAAARDVPCDGPPYILFTGLADSP